MNDALFAAASGMAAVSRRMEIAAKNAANAQTAGYLPRNPAHASFRTHLDRALGRSATFVKTREVTSFEQGNVVRSEGALDLALRGPGFLAVRAEDGSTYYTRNGNLTLDAEGTLVTQAGYPVLGITGPIRVDSGNPEKTHISSDGTIYQGRNELGRLKVVEFSGRDKLQRAGETLFSAPRDVGAGEALETTLVPGHLELPPETAVNAMVAMIDASRGYEAQQRVIRTISRSLEQLVRP